MPLDYVLLYGVHIKIALGIPAGDTRVREPVDLMSEDGFVPIVQEIVVKESASYQALAVHLDMQSLL